MSKKTVLFLCTNNSVRSQIAEAFVNNLYPKKYEAYSAGTNPTQINPFTKKVMQEVNIDITHNHAKSINEFKDKKFDIIVTVCDKVKETCPFFPGKNIINQSFLDPDDSNKSMDEIIKSFRNVRDEIYEWITNIFVKNN